MTKAKTIIKCRVCGSANTKKNGYNRYGSLQYYCHDCKARKVLNPKKLNYSEERKEEILRAHHERVSMRGINRIFGVSPITLSAWIKKKQKIVL